MQELEIALWDGRQVAVTRCEVGLWSHPGVDVFEKALLALAKRTLPAVTKGCLMEVRCAHYPLTWGPNTTPL